MIINKGNLGSYRYEYDSWTEDEDSSSSSSDTSSDSDFFQRVVESNSGPKNVPEIKTKGELGLEDLPPIEELSIEIPKEDMMLIGKIHAVVEKLVVVHAIKDMKPLDIDSVLFLDHDKPLGRVYDVFGPVVEPFYCIRFNNVEQINEKQIETGANVYFAPEKNDITSYVFVDELQKEKGSDASWKYNNEPPEECLDFSDDEKEKEARRKRLNKNRNRQISNYYEFSAKRPFAMTSKDTSDSQQNFKERSANQLFPSSKSSINMPTAIRFSPFSSLRQYPSSYRPRPPPSSILRAQNLASFSSLYPSRPPPSSSPCVVEVYRSFSNGYVSQPPPSPSTSVVPARSFSPYPNAHTYPSSFSPSISAFPNAHSSHPPPLSPSISAGQRFTSFSNPPPPPPAFVAPKFTSFSNSYPPPPPPPSSPAIPASNFNPFSNSYLPSPPPPSSPAIPASNFNPFSSSYPTHPHPSTSFSARNLFSDFYSAPPPPPPPPPLPSPTGVFTEPKLPLFTSQDALHRHSMSSSSLQTPTVTSSSQYFASPGISPQQHSLQNFFSPQSAVPRPPQHVFGQVTMMSPIESPANIIPSVNPWNKS